MKVFENPSQEVIAKMSKLSNNVVSLFPERYKQIIWESDLERFDKHVSPFVDEYLTDYASCTRNSEMIMISLSQTHKILPRDRRRNNRNLVRLRKAIGKSFLLYGFVIDKIRKSFAETGDLQYCCLRSDLLMYFHDEQVAVITSNDQCHQLAWYLDSIYKKIAVKANKNESCLEDTVKHTNSLVSEFTKIAKISKNSQSMSNQKQSRFYEAENEFNITSDTKGKSLTFQTVMRTAIHRIMREDSKKYFHAPVVRVWPELAEQYLSIIQRPMDLSSIIAKLSRNMYFDVNQIRDDLHLIADNASLFNGPDTYIAKTAEKIMKLRSQIHLDKAIERLAADKERRQRKKKKITTSIHMKGNDSLKSTAMSSELTKNESMSAFKKKALRDACMILSAFFSKTALTAFFLTRLKEHTLLQQQLPRNDLVLLNILWLLQSGCLAHEIVKDEKPIISVPSLQTRFKKRALAGFANLSLQGLEVRHPETFILGLHDDGTALRLPSLDFDFLRIGKPLFPLELFIKYFLERISLRDVFALEHIIKELERKFKLRARLIAYPGFLHSLTTSCYKSSRDVGSLAGEISVQQCLKSHYSQKRSRSRFEEPDKLNFKAFNKLVPLQPQHHEFFVKNIFLFSLLHTNYIRTTNIENETEMVLSKLVDKIATESRPQFSAVFCLKHAHFGRFMTLPSTVPALRQQNVHLCIKIAIFSIIGLGEVCPKFSSVNYKQPIDEWIEQIRQIDASKLSESQSAYLKEKFFSQEFERARKYYEKLFQQFPVLRVNCGLPATFSRKPKNGRHLQYLQRSSPSNKSPMPSPIFSPLQGASPFPVTPNNSVMGTPNPSITSPTTYIVEESSDEDLSEAEN